MASQPTRSGEQPPVSPRRAGGSRSRAGFRVGRVQVTPIRAALAVGLLGSLLYIAVAIVFVRDAAQLPMVTSGVAVLGIVFGALSIGGAIRMWRAWQDGAQAQTVVFAVLGGLAGMIALGCFAGALVLALVWKS